MKFALMIVSLVLAILLPVPGEAQESKQVDTYCGGRLLNRTQASGGCGVGTSASCGVGTSASCGTGGCGVPDFSGAAPDVSPIPAPLISTKVAKTPENVQVTVEKPNYVLELAEIQRRNKGQTLLVQQPAVVIPQQVIVPQPVLVQPAPVVVRPAVVLPAAPVVVRQSCAPVTIGVPTTSGYYYKEKRLGLLGLAGKSIEYHEYNPIILQTQKEKK